MQSFVNMLLDQGFRYTLKKNKLRDKPYDSEGYFKFYSIDNSIRKLVIISVVKNYVYIYYVDSNDTIVRSIKYRIRPEWYEDEDLLKDIVFGYIESN